MASNLVILSCPICSKIFKDRKGLSRHAVVHDESLRKAECDQCHRRFRDNNHLRRHKVSSHGTQLAAPTEHRCEMCTWAGYSKVSLREHEKTHLLCKHEGCNRRFKSFFHAKRHALRHRNMLTCSTCDMKFMVHRAYMKHVRRHGVLERRQHARRTRIVRERGELPASTNNNTTRVKCFNCTKVFNNRWLLNRHLRRECTHLEIPHVGELIDTDEFEVQYEKALRGCMAEYKLTPRVLTSDEKEFLERTDVTLARILLSLSDEGVPVKWSYRLEVKFVKTDADGNIHEKLALFRASDLAQSNLDEPDRIKEVLQEVRGSVLGKVDKYTKEGSGWVLDGIQYIVFELYRVKMRYGGSTVVLPTELVQKHCVINLITQDCFKWAVLSALHHTEVESQVRVEEYARWADEFVFPETRVICAADVAKFVSTNKLAVYLHQYSKKGKTECIYRPPKSLIATTTATGAPRVHLLLYKQHWMAITNLSRLYRNVRGHLEQMCDCCLKTFYSNPRYEEHLPCNPTDCCIQREIMPKDPALRFKDLNKCVDLADVVYGDLEAILEPVNRDGKLQRHIPCCVGAYWVSSVEGTEYKEFRGQQCMADFCEHLENLAIHIHDRNKVMTREPAEKTAAELARHEAATHCHWCKSVFVPGDRIRQKVFDHNHLTGRYRSAACQGCNNKLRQDRNTLVVAFHNLRHYDAHSLCLQGLTARPNWEVNVIAQTIENYLTFYAYITLDGRNNRTERFRIKFIDSYQLMNSALATLANNLVRNNDYSLLKHAAAMRRRYPRVSEAHLAAKGVFPYTYVDSWERLEERQLPCIDSFYDTLKECIDVTEEDYARALVMFEAFECQTLFDYQLRYLELDCRLLADVFEQFRELTRREDKMDAAHFITVSQLSYCSALKWCGTSIGLIEDPEIFRDVERCKRGGYSFVNKHICKANNPYVHPGKAHTKEDVYLANVDANNLYGNALRHSLPIGGFKYVTDYAHIDWKTINTEGDIGYFVVCDLHYPVAIQNKTAHLPLAPEIITITEEMLTPYSRQLNSRKNLGRNPTMTNPDKYTKCKKLLATCLDKREYVVHFVALQFYLKHGLEISRIHRVIQFAQAPVFRDYIDYNTQRRSEARNDFEKDFYKAKNCHLYGKSLENKRNRTEVKLCNSALRFVKVCSAPRFKRGIMFNDDLAAAELTKVNIELDAPVAIGAAVLDISKVIMYRLAYEEFPKYERLLGCKINIAGGDTDSFFLEIIGTDLYWSLYPVMLEDGLLDTSNYDPNHQLYTDTHKAELGCIKDEFAGQVYSEFVLLRPKSYSMKPAEAELGAKKRCKGVPRRKVAAFLHDDYRRVYTRQIEKSVNCRRMQSTLHVVYNIEMTKTGLSYADDKRAWLSNNYSLPYGHHMIPHLIQFPPEDFDEEADREYVRTVAELYQEIEGDDDEEEEEPQRRRQRLE